MKKNIIALIVLAALGLVAFFIFREPPADVDKEKEAPLIGPVSPDKLERLEIIRHEGTGATLREEIIVLEKAGGEWRMIKPVEYAVNATSVQGMVDALAELRIIDVISENKARHHVLEVDDEMGIEVTASGGDGELAHFIVGVARQGMTMVRIPGSETVYRSNGSFRITFNKRADNLRDHTVTKLDRDSVTRMKFFSEHGELEMVREGEEIREGETVAVPVFKPVGVEIQNFNSRAALGISRSLTGLSAKEFVDDKPGDDVTGLGEGATRVEFEARKDGKEGSYTIWLGNKDEKKRMVYVKSTELDQIFMVSMHLVSRYWAKVDDFARTDEQVAQQEKARKESREHGGAHRKHAEMRKNMPPGFSPGGMPGKGGAGGQEIPPDIMKKIQEQMKKQGAQGGKPAPKQ